jgi:uncharacterized membrane protein
LVAVTGSESVRLIIRKPKMGYELAVGPLLVAVIAFIAFMTVLYWFVSDRFREVVIGFIVAGMVLELMVILPIWVVSI